MTVQELWSELEEITSGCFLQPSITPLQRWIEVETSEGTHFIHPEDWMEFRNDYGREIYSKTEMEGYGANLSAPGYMDQTEVSVFESEKEALMYLLEWCE